MCVPDNPQNNSASEDTLIILVGSARVIVAPKAEISFYDLGKQMYGLYLQLFISM